MKLVVVLGLLASLVGATQPPFQKSSIRFEPETLRVERDASGYVQAMISVYANGPDTLRLTGIQGSCGCASASVQRTVCTSTTPGKFYCSINAKNFKDTLNTVEYTISHSGANSPTRYFVIVRCVQSSK